MPNMRNRFYHNLDTPETDPLYLELKLLGNLVADYEEDHYSLGEPSLSNNLGV